MSTKKDEKKAAKADKNEKNSKKVLTFLAKCGNIMKLSRESGEKTR